MLLFRILLKVFKFLSSPLYVDKCGFVWRSSLYSASLCFMDFSMPLVIHSLFLCLYLLNLTVFFIMYFLFVLVI